jgi:hypothetical protein
MGMAVATFAAASHATAATPLTRTNDSFCEIAQYFSANTARKAATVVHADFESFKKSKTRIAPLEIHQYVQYADSAKLQPRRISCKLKSVDHLVEHYGAADAGPEQRTCRDLHHRMALNVMQSLTPAEQAAGRFPLERIRLEGDRKTLLGSKWIADFSFVWASPDGDLHLASKALHVDYTDWVWRLAPEKFRGVYYCHLIAPEYLRAILTGQESPPAFQAE